MGFLTWAFFKGVKNLCDTAKSKKGLFFSNNENQMDIQDFYEDEILLNETLLSAMTIRPIPLQKRESSARFRNP